MLVVKMDFALRLNTLAIRRIIDFNQLVYD